MDPYAAFHALSVLEAHTALPASERDRRAVLNGFAVLAEVARLYRDSVDKPAHFVTAR